MRKVRERTVLNFRVLLLLLLLLSLAPPLLSEN